MTPGRWVRSPAHVVKTIFTVTITVGWTLLRSHPIFISCINLCMVFFYQDKGNINSTSVMQTVSVVKWMWQLIVECNAHINARSILDETPVDIKSQKKDPHYLLDQLGVIPTTREDEILDKFRMEIQLLGEVNSTLPKPKDSWDEDSLQTTAAAMKTALIYLILSGCDCCQVCRTWRKALSNDDHVWLPIIRQEISTAVSNSLDHFDKTVSLSDKTAWEHACIQWKMQTQTLTAWAVMPEEEFRNKSKEKYLWIHRKKARLPFPKAPLNLPVYNPVIHDKWWNPVNIVLCSWCYIFHSQWIDFFIQNSISSSDARKCDEKVQRVVRNSLGAVGLLWIVPFGRHICVSPPPHYLRIIFCPVPFPLLVPIDFLLTIHLGNDTVHGCKCIYALFSYSRGFCSI
ncbi:hypothetical protein Pelo_15458 [Pelomyxa schiedti]|nr:hypothetical protein Pelo_15458 [Pelomyxa schiedti]